MCDWIMCSVGLDHVLCVSGPCVCVIGPCVCVIGPCVCVIGPCVVCESTMCCV